MMRKSGSRPLRIGIIGCGGIARGKHVPEIRQSRQGTLVACADIDPKRARKLAADTRAAFWTADYHALLERRDVDGVIVATPHPAHAAIGIDVLRAGKHLLIQKPMCTTIADADRVLAAAEKARVVSLALPYMYCPWVVAVKRLIERGRLGTIRMARVRVAHGGDHKRTTWFARKELAHGGALFDLGVYSAWLLVEWLGAVREVTAMVTDSTGGVTVDQNAAMTLRFACGAVGVLETSWQQVGVEGSAAIYGMKASLRAQDERIDLCAIPNALGRYLPAKWKRVPLPRRIPMPENPIDHWADCIFRGVPVLSTIRRARHIVEILCAGYASVESRRAVRVASTP